MTATLPNILSLLRVFLAPVFFVLILGDGEIVTILACLTFAVGAASDFFDGWYARKYGVATKIGKFIDPLADKILTTAAFVAFVVLDIIPLWPVLVIFARDIMTTVLRIYGEKRKHSFPTSFSAKLKTTLQMFFISYVLILILATNLSVFDTIKTPLETFSTATYTAMIVLAVITIWTGIEYILKNKTLFRSIFG